MARISRFYPKNVRPFILLKSRCSTAFLFERRQPTFYLLQQVNKKMVNVSLKKKSQHSVLKKCVTIWTVESDAKSICISFCTPRFPRFVHAQIACSSVHYYSGVHQDFQAQCAPYLSRSRCTTAL